MGDAKEPFIEEAKKLKDEYKTKRKEYEAGPKYKKWKRDLAIWNDRYKEEWQEQRYEKKLKREEAKKKRAARKAKKEKEAQEGSDDDDEKDDEKENKKKAKKKTASNNNKGKKKATTNGNKRGRGRPKKEVNVQNSVFIPNQKCIDPILSYLIFLIFFIIFIHSKRPFLNL